jgi:hypothetical protein
MTKLIWPLVLVCAPMFFAFWVLDKIKPVRSSKFTDPSRI